MIASVQAGGRSLRMGQDKSWLILKGRPMIEYVLAAAKSVAEKTIIVIHRDAPDRYRYQQLATAWQAELIDDLHNYRGPLGGIETTLKYTQSSEAAVVLACDLPFMTAEFLRFSLDLHKTEKNDLTIPTDQAGRPQMLAAIYSPSCLSAISQMLSNDILKARLLQHRVKSRLVPYSEYAFLPQSAQILRNINTLEDYRSVATD